MSHESVEAREKAPVSSRASVVAPHLPLHPRAALRAVARHDEAQVRAQDVVGEVRPAAVRAEHRAGAELAEQRGAHAGHALQQRHRLGAQRAARLHVLRLRRVVRRERVPGGCFRC